MFTLKNINSLSSLFTETRVSKLRYSFIVLEKFLFNSNCNKYYFLPQRILLCSELIINAMSGWKETIEK